MLLDDHRLTRPAEVAAKAAFQPSAGVGPAVRHQHPLPGGQPVRLDDIRRVEAVQVASGLLTIGEPGRGGGGHTGPPHHLLGEPLGGLQPGGRPSRTEGPNTLGLQGIDDTGGQRRLRSDHH